MMMSSCICSSNIMKSSGYFCSHIGGDQQSTSSALVCAAVWHQLYFIGGGGVDCFSHSSDRLLNSLFIFHKINNQYMLPLLLPPL
jgi:hypothetical protein